MALALENETTNLLWMDLEMTGLDPSLDEIIEVATVVTTSSLDIVEVGPTLVLYQPEVRLAQMDNWNRKHHRESKLWDEVVKSPINVIEAEEMILQFVKSHFQEKKGVLCGNSIWQDRRFIRKHMPRLDSYLHYRMIDVSTVKELIKIWYFKKKEKEKSNKHRAYDDILESIEELRYYRKNFFVHVG